MEKKLVVLLLTVSFFAGCSRELRLYPVGGPQSEKNPMPVFVGKITGAWNFGNASLVLSDGETCKGHWAQMPLPHAGTPASATTPGASDMATVWDAIYGSGFYVAHVLGTRHFAKATLKGNKGTLLNLEMFATEGSQPGEPLREIRGVAKDNHDNIYKVAL